MNNSFTTTATLVQLANAKSFTRGTKIFISKEEFNALRAIEKQSHRLDEATGTYQLLEQSSMVAKLKIAIDGDDEFAAVHAEAVAFSIKHHVKLPYLLKGNKAIYFIEQGLLNSIGDDLGLDGNVLDQLKGRKLELSGTVKGCIAGDLFTKRDGTTDAFNKTHMRIENIDCEINQEALSTVAELSMKYADKVVAKAKAQAQSAVADVFALAPANDLEDNQEEHQEEGEKIEIGANVKTKAPKASKV